MLDVKDIAKGTSREDELFEYSNVLDQYRTIRTPLYEAGYDDYEYGEFDKEKDDYDMSL